MQEIIPPIDRQLLLQELNETTFLRHTNKGDNELYVIDDKSAPNTLKEIGRLREISFRDGGGGTGLDCDLDEHDYGQHCYKQLVVWDPENHEIIGGYRYIYGADAIQDNGEPCLSTAELFDYSPTFVKEILPNCIELGRSFVQPKYQPQNNRKGLFSLDNLWDGLGALIVEFEDLKYLFGKVTMYRNYNQEARDILLIFCKQFFGKNHPPLLTSKPDLKADLYAPRPDFENAIKDLDYTEALKLTNQKIKDLGERIPPLINSYMSVSPTMHWFDTAINHHFGDVEETAILVTNSDIFPEKKERHIVSYNKQTKDKSFLRSNQ